MGKCINCGIEILDEADHCPLCRSILEPTGEMEDMYPDVRLRMRKLTLFSRIYLFCAILAGACLVGMDLLFQPPIWWNTIVALVLLYLYLVLRYAILGRSGYRSKILVLSLIGILAAVAADFIIGYQGWSVDYVLPGGILLVDVIILGCMFYNRRNWQSYLMWQLLMILCSLFPAGLFLAGLERNEYIAFLPLVTSVAIFTGTLIIGDRRARQELRRRFHIN